MINFMSNNSKIFNMGLISLLIFSVVFVSGCTQSVNCEPPYIKDGNSCCLDRNSNSICDKDEQTQQGNEIKEKQSTTPPKSSSSICDNIINNSNMQNYCKAIELKDPSFCYKVDRKGIYHGDTEQCLYYLAVSYTKNVSICDEIKDPTKRWECKAFVNKDLDLCKRIIKNKRDECYYGVGWRALNPDACGLINITNEKRNWCYESIAYQTKDLSLCDKISSPLEGAIEGCKQHILYEKMLDGEIDVNLSLCGCNMQYCRLPLAKLKKDPRLCEMSPNGTEEGCGSFWYQVTDFENYCKGVVNNDEEYCYKIDGNYRGYCFYEIAIQKKDNSLCYELDNPEGCLSAILNNTEGCFKIEDVEKRNDCLYTISVNTKTPKNCELITDLSQRNLCYFQIVDRLARNI